jgi:hypothetical protein
MQAMYEEYGELVEFRLVYINEAHAADGQRPVPYAKQMGIKEHHSVEDRCSTAKMLLDSKELTIPTLTDEMDDAVNKAYAAFPDRIYLVRSDGRLAVAASRGPAGFAPALTDSKEWLAQFKKSGREPELPDSASEPGDEAVVKNSLTFPD